MINGVASMKIKIGTDYDRITSYNVCYTKLLRYFSFNHSGYDHYGYRSSADDVVILSTPERKSFHFVLLFAFLFVLIFSVASIGRYFLFLRIGGSDTRFSLSFRIRIFVITTLIVSFVLTGAAAIYFNIRQENQKIRGVLSENVNTIITRLEQFRITSYNVCYTKLLRKSNEV